MTCGGRPAEGRPPHDLGRPDRTPTAPAKGGPGQVFAARGRDLASDNLRRNPDVLSIPVAGLAEAPIAVTISPHPRWIAGHGPVGSSEMTSGVSWDRDVSTRLAVRSTDGSGGYLALGIAITCIPAAAAARSPLVESSTAAHFPGGRPSRAATAR